MSLRKKIISFFFEESDEDVIVDDEIKDIKFDNSDKIVDTTYEQIKKTNSDVNMVGESNEISKQEISKFVNIEVEKKVETSKETKEIKTKQAYHRDEKKEYEYTPVISPMFGVAEHENKQNLEKKHPKKSMRVIKKKTNPLETIISPYFGLGELEEFDTKTKQDKEKVEDKEESFIISNQDEKAEISDISVQESLFSEEVMNEIKKEESKAVPLETIISNDSEKDKENLMQISLFGDSTPIKELEASMNNVTNK